MRSWRVAVPLSEVRLFRSTPLSEPFAVQCNGDRKGFVTADVSKCVRPKVDLL